MDLCLIKGLSQSLPEAFSWSRDRATTRVLSTQLPVLGCTHCRLLTPQMENQPGSWDSTDGFAWRGTFSESPVGWGVAAQRGSWALWSLLLCPGELGAACREASVIYLRISSVLVGWFALATMALTWCHAYPLSLLWASLFQPVQRQGKMELHCQLLPLDCLILPPFHHTKATLIT